MTDDEIKSCVDSVIKAILPLGDIVLEDDKLKFIKLFICDSRIISHIPSDFNITENTSFPEIKEKFVRLANCVENCRNKK